MHAHFFLMFFYSLDGLLWKILLEPIEKSLATYTQTFFDRKEAAKFVASGRRQTGRGLIT